MDVYPAKYADERGEYETTVRNDWKVLRMSVRGIEFSGTSFDCFQPDENSSREFLNTFSLSEDDRLSDFYLECEIPVRILENENESGSVLIVMFRHKTIENSEGFYDYDLSLTLKYGEQEFRSTGAGDFEDCFGEIKTQLRKLPNQPVLKCCFACGLSDYSVYGHDVFGSMICFKNLKQRYLNIKTHYDYYDLLEENELEYVQEIYLCPEYHVRRPDAYYRG